MCRLTVLAALCGLSLALTQEVPPRTDGVSYLLRLERLRPGQDVCVLVRGDGLYHLEILYRAKARILEGALPPETLRDLVRTLSQDKLFQLQQQDIHTPLVQSGLDELSVSVLRAGSLAEPFLCRSAEPRAVPGRSRSSLEMA